LRNFIETTRSVGLACLILTIVAATAPGHEIPNARVDRSIQATMAPGRLTIDYEVSLAELTLTQDLRALVGGPLPGTDRADWFNAYGRETGPLNARGILVTIDGRPARMDVQGFDLVVEDHPRFTFHFATPIPPRGRLALHDTNFSTSEGTSRLAMRALAGVTVRVQGDDLPTDVNRIPIRPTWQLSDREELRTHQLVAEYRTEEVVGGRGSVKDEHEEQMGTRLPSPLQPTTSHRPPTTLSEPTTDHRPPATLLRLLDRDRGLSLAMLSLVALGLGGAHAIQPGHGKTLVAATVLGDRGSWLRGTVLALVTTLTHTGSVVLIAAALWWTRSTRFSEIHFVLARVAGFAIAAIGLWRLGRHLAGHGEHPDDFAPEHVEPSRHGLLWLGVAGGLVPCWDAIGLIVLAGAWGRPGLGLILLLAFSLGMALVLVLVGALATRLRRWLESRPRARSWEHRLGIASGLVLTAIGVYIMNF
jgi:ABC-type nickel/cobalt efflux system permease component RcnA